MIKSGFFLDIPDETRENFYQPMLENRKINLPVDLEKLTLEEVGQATSNDPNVNFNHGKRLGDHRKMEEDHLSIAATDKSISPLKNEIEQLKEQLINAHRQEQKLVHQLLVQGARIEKCDQRINDLVVENHQLLELRNILKFQIKKMKNEYEKLKQGNDNNLRQGGNGFAK